MEDLDDPSGVVWLQFGQEAKLRPASQMTTAFVRVCPHAGDCPGPLSAPWIRGSWAFQRACTRVWEVT